MKLHSFLLKTLKDEDLNLCTVNVFRLGKTPRGCSSNQDQNSAKHNKKVSSSVKSCKKDQKIAKKVTQENFDKTSKACPEECIRN